MNHDFMNELDDIDYARNRLKDFKKIVKKMGKNDLDKKINFLFPMNAEFNHWSGAVISFDPNSEKENKYSYIFFDSLNEKPGGMSADEYKPIKAKIKEIFGNDIKKNKESPGFYNQGDNQSCGPCTVANMMMYVGVKDPANKTNMNGEIRAEQAKLVPSLADRVKNPYEKVANILSSMKDNNIDMLLKVVTQSKNQKDFNDKIQSILDRNYFESFLSDDEVSKFTNFRFEVNNLCKIYNINPSDLDKSLLKNNISKVSGKGDYKENDQSLDNVKEDVSLLNSSTKNHDELNNSNNKSEEKSQEGSVYSDKEYINLENDDLMKVTRGLKKYDDLMKATKGYKLTECEADFRKLMKKMNKEDSIDNADRIGKKAQKFFEKHSEEDLQKLQENKYNKDKINDLDDKDIEILDKIFDEQIKVKSNPLSFNEGGVKRNLFGRVKELLQNFVNKFRTRKTVVSKPIIGEQTEKLMRTRSSKSPNRKNEIY